MDRLAIDGIFWKALARSSYKPGLDEIEKIQAKMILTFKWKLEFLAFKDTQSKLDQVVQSQPKWSSIKVSLPKIAPTSHENHSCADLFRYLIVN